MKVNLRIILASAAIGCLFLHAGLHADQKKETEKKEESKEVVVNGALIQADLKDKVRNGCYCKTYTYKMTEGKTYQIDMKSTDFDSYLRLENPQGVQVAFDDDSGGFPDARIIYPAPKTGDYQIICTTFAPDTTGKFKLLVKEVGGPDGK